MEDIDSLVFEIECETEWEKYFAFINTNENKEALTIIKPVLYTTFRTAYAFGCRNTYAATTRTLRERLAKFEAEGK